MDEAAERYGAPEHALRSIPVMINGATFCCIFD